MIKRTFLFFSLAILIYCMQSCSLVGPGRPTITDALFRVKIDSVRLPTPMFFAEDTLKIAFWGNVGSDSCYKFDHFQGAKDTHQIDLVLWGRNSRTSNDVCPSGQIDLNGKIFFDYPVAQGDYTVVIHQPDGSIIQRTIHVYP
jgi:hypothetical protein